MRCFSLIRAFFCAIAGCFAFVVLPTYAQSTCPSTQAGRQVTLPVEVLGPDGYIERVEFDLPTATGIDRLYMQCHRCGWRDGTVASGKARGAKASVRLNGGAWVNIEDANISMQEPEKSFGGLSGGFHTTRFTVPITGARAGMNALEFRFNKTDGFTSGYRVLAFNLRGGNNANAIPTSTFVDDDPAAWRVNGTQADIDEGRALWQGKVALRESPLSPKVLKANCSACHAADGRDLKYFNYSDWSIAERSIFHGLSEAQGRQIAAYVRSLNAPAPKQARPWNPPYQPGPGLDAKPAEEWAAGAGIQAVLNQDRDMLPYLFTSGTSASAIDSVASVKGTLNIRELPVPLQLPDWNAWLPDVHPEDIWPDRFAASDVPRAYNDARQNLSSDLDTKIADRRVIGIVESFLNRSWKATFTYMGGPIPCIVFEDAKTKGTVPESLMKYLPAGKTCEDGLHATNNWLAVKNWELFHTFNLEDVTPRLYPYGEKRGWFGRERNVFEVASHRAANTSQNFRFQSSALGSYHSSAWYHLQMVLNAGHRDPYTWFPQDWFYTPLFIALNSRDNRQPLALLNTAMHIKMYQNLDMTGPDGLGTDRGPGYNGWWLPFVTPWRFESTIGWEAANANWAGGISADQKTSKGFPWTHLDNYEPGLRLKVTNALLRQFLRKMKSYPISQLPRQTDVTKVGNDRFEHPDFIVPTNLPPPEQGCYYTCPGPGYQAQDFYRSAARFREIGVDPALRSELIDWLKLVYRNPQNNWDALR
jgi:hypothetical protein